MRVVLITDPVETSAHRCDLFEWTDFFFLKGGGFILSQYIRRGSASNHFSREENSSCCPVNVYIYNYIN